MTASLLPNGKQQFIDINGSPLVGGTVGLYIPSTLTPKNTWQNSAQSILNTNPIILDARGEAIIWGAGTYRQIVKDASGNTIWDQITNGYGTGSGGSTTTITVSNSPYTISANDSVVFCDVSGGAITVNLIAATLYGSQVSIKIKGTNTNPVTILPNGSDTIDGAASYVLAFTNQSITLASDYVSYWGTI